jgi:hypothetical protein
MLRQNAYSHMLVFQQYPTLGLVRHNRMGLDVESTVACKVQ